MIAMALVHNPAVLIADEPTTALDVTVQAQILELIDKVKRDFDIGVILITHDLGVVAETAQTVMVMYAGRAVEHGPARRGLRQPAAPVHLGPARVDAEHRGQGRAPARDRGLAAVASSTCRPAAPFHPRCPHRFDPCDKRAAAARDDRGRPRRRLPPRRRRRSGGSGPSARPPPGDRRVSIGRRSADRGRAPDQALPGGLGRVHARHGRGARRRGRDAERAPRRDARHRGRVGLRQVDDRAPHAQAARADGGHDPLRRPRHHEPQPRATCGRCGARCR